MLFEEKYRSTNHLDHNILGDLAMELGQYDRAIMHYKKEVENIFKSYEEEEEVYDIDDVGGIYLPEELYNKIAEVYQYKKEYEGAIEYTKLIIEEDNRRGVNKGRATIELAKLYTLNNQIDIAEEILVDLLSYEIEEMKKEYDGSYPKGLFDNCYEKDLYMQACYELINLFKDTDYKKGLYYIELALNIYNSYEKKMSSEGARILELQAEFYEKNLDTKLKNGEMNIKSLSKDEIDTLEKICRNKLIASRIYINDYEKEDSKRAISEAIEYYNKYNLDDYKLNFELKYEFAKIYEELSYLGGYDDRKQILNKYLEAFKILKEHDFFDEYRKNMILIELASYSDDYDISQEYLAQCDYYYIAEYNVEHSDKKIVAFIKEYKDAGDSYKSLKNYDMALKCYEKALENLIRLEIFEGKKIKEDEFDEFYLDTSDLFHLGFYSYVRICQDIAEVYLDKEDYENELDYLKKAINCVEKYRYDEEFNGYNYMEYASLYRKILELRIKKGDYKYAVDDYLFILGIFNSKNKNKSINEEFEDIQLLNNLHENGQIREYILSDKYKFNLENNWLYAVEEVFKELLKIGEKIEDKDLIQIIKQRIKFIKDIPFDIDVD